MTQKIFDLFNLVDFKLTRGRGIYNTDKYVTYTSSFDLHFNVMRNYLTGRVFSKLGQFSQSKSKMVKGLLGIPMRAGLSETTDMAVSILTTDILAVIKIFISFPNPMELISNIKMMEVEMPDFMLKTIQMINYVKLNRTIIGSDTLIINTSNEVRFYDKEIGSKNKHQINMICVCLMEVNQTLKLLGFGSFVVIKDYNEFFKTNENNLNVIFDPKILDGKIESVKIECGAGHTEEDLEIGLLSMPNYVFTKNVIRTRGMTLSARDCFDLVFFNVDMLESEKYLNNDKTLIVDRLVDASLKININNTMEGAPYSISGKRSLTGKNRVEKIETIESDVQNE